MPQGPFNTLVAKIVGLNSYSWLQLGKQLDLLNSQLRGGKYTAAYQGAMFDAANSAGVTMSSGLATTYLGICLSNPAGSTKNLSVRKVTGLTAVAPAAVQPLGLIAGFAAGGITAHTTALTVQNGVIGSAVTAAQAKVDSACTLVGTPVWFRHLAVNAASAALVGFNEEINGGIIIPPGGYLAVGSFGAAGPTNGFLGSFEWDEVAP